MKKSTSLLLSGILVSGMVLGTVVTPATVVNAAEDATSESKDTSKDNQVTNLITFIDGTTGKAVGASVSVKGNVGDTISPEANGLKDYQLYPGTTAKMLADGKSQDVKVINNADITSITISYTLDGRQVATRKVANQVVNTKYKVEQPDAKTGYVLVDDNQTVNVAKKGVFTAPVTANISNSIIFKTSDGIQVNATKDQAEATISGKKVGDVIDITSQLPAGYTADNSKVTLQANGNTQIVTVKKTADGITPFKSTVETKSDSAFIPLYTSTGKSALRGLAAGTDWATNNKMILDGVTYYQVSTTEFVKASDVTVKGNVDTSTDTNTDTNTDAVASDKSTVTTKNVAFTPLYTKDGKVIGDRGLGANSPWHSDLMITVNGVKMYRVATNEWVKASAIK